MTFKLTFFAFVVKMAHSYLDIHENVITGLLIQYSENVYIYQFNVHNYLTTGQYIHRLSKYHELF